MLNPKKVEQAIKLIENGSTLRDAAKTLSVSRQTLHDWLSSAEYIGRYAAAREAGWHSIAEEIVAISDESAGDVRVDPQGNQTPNAEYVARSRLRVDSRKWLLSKMLPKVYGDKLETESTVTHKFEGMRDRLAAQIGRIIDSDTAGETDRDAE